MNLKTILGIVIIVVFVIFGSYSFFESNLEYTDVEGAMKTAKKVQLKGTWNREKDARFDAERTQFSFYLVDESGKECMVVLDGAAPNNFDMATSVVAKGQYVRDGHYFHATEVLTKCPSKYEAGGDQINENT
jgi:cytochrome c-type biogenesis protein CcmE